ncbi:MAG: hypothetical protein QY326_06700 [Bdellovibrionota bacterium]|nr:MAG: hypothetical protein QY326_06700 [Bdellovibrionota bacterium]
MKQFYVPYSGKRPAALSINGHRLLILASDPTIMEGELEVFGADHVKRIDGGASKQEESKLIERLSRDAKAGVVIAPADIGLSELLRNLEHELPWLQ